MEWLYAKHQPLKQWLRYFSLLLAGVLVGLVLMTTALAQSALAADATWTDNGSTSLLYGNETYTKSTDQALHKTLGIDASALVYIKKTGNTTTKVIFFQAPSGSSGDVTASHKTYTLTAPNTYTEADTKQITVAAPSENNANVSCDVQGLGWIICPLSNNLASAMDWMYNRLEAFLEVKPLQTTNQNSGVYIAWSIMRNIANVAFIVAFLVIIYSQITSAGISNYGIKKTLPRLIAAAVLVNMSFVICAVLLDISNIAGYAVQDMFIGIKNTVMTLGQNTNVPADWGWEEVTSTILGTPVAAGAAVYFGKELLPFLLPLLVGVSLALLVVLLVMAARQALIVILIVISPLAFVCYLLPGTEKWFEKWKEVFATMLLFFPAFAVAFGGAQLAGMLIIQSANGPNGAMMHILGMAVQIAPLALTPLMLKLGGGVLNRFTGLVNDKKRGAFDRSMNWARDKQQTIRNNKLANAGRRNVISRARRNMDHSRRRDKAALENSEKALELSYLRSRRNAEMDRQRRGLERDKQLAETGLETDWAEHQEHNAAAAARELKLRTMKDKQAYAQSRLDSRYEEFRAGKYKGQTQAEIMQQMAGRSAEDRRFAAELTQDMADAQQFAQGVATEALRKNNAQRVQNKVFAEEMVNNQALQQYAGGIHEYGADSALANAVATTRGESAKSVEEANQVLDYFEANAGQRQALAKGESVTLTNSSGVSRRFDANNLYVREAALAQQLELGTVNEVVELIGTLPPEFRDSLKSGLAKSGVKSKAPFLGGKLIDDIVKGAINSPADVQKHVASWIQEGKFKADDLVSTDAQGVDYLINTLQANPGGIITPEARAKLAEKIDTIMDSRNIELNRSVTEAAAEKFSTLRNML